MSARSVLLCLSASMVLLAGCTSWARLPDGRPLPARGTVQVWSGGQAAFLRDPQAVGDSLVGQGPLPDTARRIVPLATIDSLRIQTADMGKSLIVGSGVAILLGLAYLQNLQGLE